MGGDDIRYSDQVLDPLSILKNCMWAEKAHFVSYGYIQMSRADVPNLLFTYVTNNVCFTDPTAMS